MAEMITNGTGTSKGALSVRRDRGRPRLIRGGEPVILRTATEHYGAVLNRPFDHGAYLEMLAASGCNLTRTFVLFRELQSAENPYSTCKPESIDYISPYPRVRPGMADVRALDGQPKFDLDQWNPEFFERLHAFLSEADAYDVVVELTILSNTYADAIWALNPLHPDNNIQGLPRAAWPEYLSLRHRGLVDRQRALVRKIVEECADHPNVIFELCNEPGGDAPVDLPSGAVTTGEVNAWLAELTQEIRDTDRGRHLVAGQQGFHYEPWEQPLDLTLGDMDVDIVNVHPLPNTVIGGRGHELGRFMRGDLALRQVADFCRAAGVAAKPVNLDEDNAATQYTNDFGWTLHRKRAWVAVLNGCHYDMIDFTIRPGVSFDAGGQLLRRWTRFLGRACERWAVADAVGWDGFTLAPADHDLVAVGTHNGAGSWLLYVSDAAEAMPTDTPADQHVELRLTLPLGSYRVAIHRPSDGSEVATMAWDSTGSESTLDLPQFVNDLLVVVETVSP